MKLNDFTLQVHEGTAGDVDEEAKRHRFSQKVTTAIRDKNQNRKTMATSFAGNME